MVRDFNKISPAEKREIKRAESVRPVMRDIPFQKSGYEESLPLKLFQENTHKNLIASKVQEELFRGDPNGGIMATTPYRGITEDAEFNKSVRTVTKPSDKSSDFDVLVPLKDGIIVALKEKGISTAGTIENLTYRFYDNVVKPSEEGSMTDSANVAKEVVVESVFNFFQKSAKKASTDPSSMTKMEKLAAAGFQQANEEIEKAVNEEVSSTVGDWVVDHKGLIIGLTLLFVLMAGFFVFRGSK